jgi:hypothetical protein
VLSAVAAPLPRATATSARVPPLPTLLLAKLPWGGFPFSAKSASPRSPGLAPGFGGATSEESKSRLVSGLTPLSNGGLPSEVSRCSRPRGSHIAVLEFSGGAAAPPGGPKAALPRSAPGASRANCRFVSRAATPPPATAATSVDDDVVRAAVTLGVGGSPGPSRAVGNELWAPSA